MLSIDAFLPSILTIDELSVKVESHALFFAFELYPQLLYWPEALHNKRGPLHNKLDAVLFLVKESAPGFLNFFL